MRSILFFIGIVLSMSASAQGQRISSDTTQTSRFAVGLKGVFQYGQWSPDKRGSHFVDDGHALGLGVEVGYTLFPRLTLNSGLNVLRGWTLRLPQHTSHSCECFVGSRIYSGGNWWQVDIPLRLRYRTNKQRRFGVHFEAGASAVVATGQLRSIWQACLETPKEKEAVDAHFLTLDGGMGINYRVGSSTQLMLSAIGRFPSPGSRKRSAYLGPPHYGKYMTNLSVSLGVRHRLR